MTGILQRREPNHSLNRIQTQPLLPKLETIIANTCQHNDNHVKPVEGPIYKPVCILNVTQKLGNVLHSDICCVPPYVKNSAEKCP
jgi:hypothetical protein